MHAAIEVALFFYFEVLNMLFCQNRRNFIVSFFESNFSLEHLDDYGMADHKSTFFFSPKTFFLGRVRYDIELRIKGLGRKNVYASTQRWFY